MKIALVNANGNRPTYPGYADQEVESAPCRITFPTMTGHNTLTATHMLVDGADLRPLARPVHICSVPGIPVFPILDLEA
jgi:hypothetical protein